MASTSQYVRKFGLRESDKFDHKDFISDFTLDFLSLVEWYKLKSNFSRKIYLQLIDETRKKWDSISNKTMGQLPEKLWNYFYATVVKPLEEDLFPEFLERIKEIKNYNIDQLADYLRANGINVSKTYYRFGAYWDKAERMNNATINVALSEFQRRMEIKQEREDKEDQKRWEERERKWQEEYEKRRKRAFNFLSAILRVSSIPTTEFNRLGLSADANIDEVKFSYKKLSMVHHPDKGGNQQKFIELTEAKNKCLAYLEKK